MMQSIIDDIKIVLNENKFSFSEVTESKKYIEASDLYKSLIASGYTKPRGNNLLSKDKSLISSISFNK